jgi:hypothetical protein
MALQINFAETAGNDMVDAEMRSLCGDCQSKRSRADDEQFFFVLRHPLIPVNPLILSTI